MVKGKFHQKRNYVTPGPQLSHFGLTTTWQLDDTTQEWECKELQKKWKLLQDPHAPFQGKGIRAIMLFQQSCTQESKVAQIGGDDSKFHNILERRHAEFLALGASSVTSLFGRHTKKQDSGVRACYWFV